MFKPPMEFPTSVPSSLSLTGIQMMTQIYQVSNPLPMQLLVLVFKYLGWQHIIFTHYAETYLQFIS